MRVCGCAPFVQGYGLTETCAASFVSYWSAPVRREGGRRGGPAGPIYHPSHVGHKAPHSLPPPSFPFSLQDQMRSVGPPMPVVTVRLEAVPEMGYDPLGDPPRGEVLVKGDAVTRGYYKNEVRRTS